MSKKILFIFLFIFIAIGASGIFLFSKTSTGRNFIANNIQAKVISTERKPTMIKVGDNMKVKYPDDFTILLLGDSMTEKLGNSDELRANLKKAYPDKTIEVLNYGFGSTNILSVQQRLESDTFYTRTFRPILDIAFDMIIFESFGHNPLSQFPLEEGLKKQNEALDNAISAIQRENPKAKIVFLATIAPNKKHYAENIVNMIPDERAKWAEERIAYIQNHIQYAKSHNIPVIDVFDKSLNSDGDANLDYINQSDYIHPSPNGVYLISDEISKYIIENKLLEAKN
jgi:lysophospholipase L1-like esterase